MKVPLSWLREYVPHTLSPAELADRLTQAGLEVAGVKVLGLPVPEGLNVKADERGPLWDRDKVIIGELVKVEPHPNADRLTRPTIHYGTGRTQQVVTGAPNIKVGDQGQKVVLGLLGTQYFDGHAKVKQLGTLKPGKIRGVPSEGMVMSEFELGISEEHEGIILLEADAPVGTPLADYMGDVVLELDVLPNMARCLALIGIAREVAALTGTNVKLPAAVIKAGGDSIEGQVDVVIEDPKLSARYAAGLIKNVTIGPAPGWMRRRLTYAGMRPINNIVDITNYVMLEWGQPLHAFDYDKLRARAGGKAPTITVRPAQAGEVIKTLDKVERKLTPENLIIADTKGPIAIAGVMGGADTEVSAETKNILLESASFDFVSVRRTMRTMNLPSEASVRFSKGVPAASVKPAAERALALIAEFGGGTVASGLVDRYPAPRPPQVVELDLDDVSATLGMDIPAAEVTRVLRALEFNVEASMPRELSVTVPPHRLDIQAGEAVLIEDLIRIHGYRNLPATLLADKLPEQHGNEELAREEQVRDILVGAGLQEVITYALTEPAHEQPLGVGDAGYVELENPISSERSVLRQSVLGSVLEVAATNLKNTDDVRLFEVGLAYVPKAGERFPDEQRRLAVVLAGRREPEYWKEAGSKPPLLDFFDIKGVVEALAGDLHLPDVAYQPSKTAYLHPGKSADLLVKGEIVGSFGQMNPRVVRQYSAGLKGYESLRDRELFVGEFDLQAIVARVPARFTYTPVPIFPAALRDIAVIVDDSMTSERIEAEIRAAGGSLLRGVRLFDLYKGDSIPADRKSLAYALTYQADDRTLTDKEVDKAHKKIEDRLKHMLKASIRGEEAAK
jgi:phenylalanyl-tRNA synthetase beta chain